MDNYLRNRGGRWHYVRRVPKRYAAFDPREIVRLSTGKTDLEEARRVAIEINRSLEAFWASLVAGNGSPGALERAIERARALGVSYMPHDQMALSDIVERLELLEKRNLVGSKPAAEAVLGLVNDPGPLLSQIPDIYFGLVGASLMNKAPDQKKRYMQPRQRAFVSLVEVIGDKPVSECTRRDALRFRSWWSERIIEEGLSSDSANKNITQIATMIREVSEKQGLDIMPVFDKMRIKGAEASARRAFSAEWIAGKILAENALSRLNEEARAVILVMINTGMRPSEIVNLSKDRIKVDHEIPHVIIAADGRSLKTRSSARVMPLCGVSLEAMRGFPSGFPRYTGRADVFSALANKYLKNNGLKPSDMHTVYSLRHSFKDRMDAARVPDRVQKDLMGHTLGRVRYGDGADLKTKAEWVRLVSY